MFRREIPGYRMQKRYVKKDGDIIWTNLTASVIRDAEGLPLYGLAMIEDITETKRAHEEAIARQKLEGLGVLAGGIAHDFNNLLGSILATSELVLSELPGGSPACDGVESIKNVADRAAEIVRQMMAYAGQEKTAFEPLDLSGLVNEMLQLLKVSISKRAHLTVDLPENLPAVRANAAQIRQVVMNLITNASEALGGKEGIISVTLVHVRLRPGTACRQYNKPPPERLPPPDGQRYRLRHDRRDPGQDLRSVLHHQIRRARSGPRRCAGNHPRPRRHNQRSQRSRPGFPL